MFEILYNRKKFNCVVRPKICGTSPLQLFLLIPIKINFVSQAEILCLWRSGSSILSSQLKLSSPTVKLCKMFKNLRLLHNPNFAETVPFSEFQIIQENKSSQSREVPIYVTGWWNVMNLLEFVWCIFLDIHDFNIQEMI